MKRFAQIELEKVHWIFEAEERPEFAPNIVLVDITDQPDVQEGWHYDFATGIFTEPAFEPEPIPDLENSEPQPSMEEIQVQTLLNTELLLIYKEIGM
ncbi:hypothetical protein MKY41_01615 [Sporosarcina sp. FSL W7-1349]|uniref:hypothetical protein n=1 Tax=Sporosarcina sp. FSL W7-1349 TaxID=2921561 RepID=UPI0030F6B92D